MEPSVKFVSTIIDAFPNQKNGGEFFIFSGGIGKSLGTGIGKNLEKLGPSVNSFFTIIDAFPNQKNGGQFFLSRKTGQTRGGPLL